MCAVAGCIGDIDLLHQVGMLHEGACVISWCVAAVIWAAIMIIVRCCKNILKIINKCSGQLIMGSSFSAVWLLR